MSITRRTFFGLMSGLPVVCSGSVSAEEISEPQRIMLNTFSVAGFQYYRGREVVRDIRSGEQATLVPEPSNPHDKYAVEIFRNGVKLGYVPRTDNKHISRMLRNGVELQCQIFDTNPEAFSWNAVMVRVFLVQA